MGCSTFLLVRLGYIYDLLVADLSFSLSIYKVVSSLWNNLRLAQLLMQHIIDGLISSARHRVDPSEDLLE